MDSASPWRPSDPDAHLRDIAATLDVIARELVKLNETAAAIREGVLGQPES